MKKLFIILQGFQLVAFSAQICYNQYVRSKAPIIHKGWFNDDYEFPIMHAEVRCTKVNLTSTAELSYFNSGNYDTHFIVSKSNVTTLFGSVFEQIPKTAVINMSNNFIENIETGAFGHLNNLRMVSLQFNNLTTIQDGLFVSNKALQTLDLSYNRIFSIGNAFPESSLQTLYLQHNQLHCVDYKLPATLFNLDLSFNEIDAIAKESFFGLTSLSTLLLNDNRLEAIPVGCFKDLNQLKQLNLSSNKLKVEFGMFFGLQKVHYMSMANNSIKTLAPAAFCDLVNLTDVDIEDNLISELDGDAIAKYLKSLETIRLNGNRFACNYLAELIIDLKKRGIAILKGNNFFTSNVQGIPCADIQDVTTEISDYVKNDTKQQTEILQKILESLNTSRDNEKNAMEDFFRNSSKIAEASAERTKKLNEVFLAEFRETSLSTQKLLVELLRNFTEVSFTNHQETKNGFNESFISANNDLQIMLAKSFEELKDALRKNSDLNLTREIGERLISALSINNKTQSDVLMHVKIFLNESNGVLQNFSEDALKHYYEESKYFKDQDSAWKQTFNESVQLLAESFKQLLEVLQKNASNANLNLSYPHDPTNQSLAARIEENEIKNVIKNIYDLLLEQKNATEAVEGFQKFHKKAWFDLGDDSLLYLLCHFATFSCIFVIMLVVMYQSCVKCWSYKERRSKSIENVNELHGFF